MQLNLSIMQNNIHLPCVSSTLTYLKEKVEEQLQVGQFLPAYFTITADKQEQGRGRKGKIWESESGENVLLSVLLYPNVTPSQQFNVCRMVSLSLIRLLEQTFGLNNVSIKWPNDIYIRDKKIVGILIEHSIQGEQIKYTIAGIGLNVNQAKFPSTLPNPTSIFLETGEKSGVFSCAEGIIDKLKQMESVSVMDLEKQYNDCLYLRDTYAEFILPKISDKPMLLKIMEVNRIGLLQLSDKENRLFSCAFDEIIYLHTRRI